MGPVTVYGPVEGQPRELPIPDYICDCCDLPLCFGKSKGLGYLCVRCITHFDIECHPSASLTQIDAWVAERDAQHAEMAAAWRALTTLEDD